MARSNSVNYTGAHSFTLANADSDSFVHTDVQQLAATVDAHTHDGAGNGLAVTGAGGNVNTFTYEAQAVTGSTITLPQTPATNGVLGVYINGQALMQTRDWTISGAVITLTTALSADDVHVEYMVLTATGADAATVDGFSAYAATNVQPSALVATGADHKLPAGAVPAIANLLTNGGFELWQRGPSGFGSNGVYFADRWQLVLGAGAFNAAKDTTNMDVGSIACAAFGNSAAGNYIQQALPITDTQQIAGRTFTLSMRVKTNTANTIRVQLTDAVTSALSTYHPGDNTYHTLSTTLTVATNATALYVRALFDAGAGGYLDNAMLVVGSTPADYQPLHPADDLNRCLRYYEKLDDDGGNVLGVVGIATSAGQFMDAVTAYRALKPVTPTVTVAGTWSASNCAAPPSNVGASKSMMKLRATSSAAGQFYVTNQSATANVILESNP
jgi:hypothetical protein